MCQRCLLLHNLLFNLHSHTAYDYSKDTIFNNYFEILFFMAEVPAKCQWHFKAGSLLWWILNSVSLLNIGSMFCIKMSYLRQRVFRGWLLFNPLSKYSISSVNSWFSPNSTTSLKCFTCWTTVYNWKRQICWPK